MNVTQQLQFIIDRLISGGRVYHTRYNDGEANQLLSLKPEGSWGSENMYQHSMGVELRRCFRETCLDLSGDVLVGSMVNTDPAHEASTLLLQWLRFQGVQWNRVRSAVGEFWCQEEVLEGVEELCTLLNFLRQSGKCVLICNEHIANARHCLGAQTVVIPDRDAWSDRVRIEQELSQYNEHIFVWCAGIPAKIWSWDIWKRSVSSHIDFGHTFDGIFGQVSREWMKRDTPMSRYYYSEFSKEVKRWIP